MSGFQKLGPLRGIKCHAFCKFSIHTVSGDLLSGSFQFNKFKFCEILIFFPFTTKLYGRV